MLRRALDRPAALAHDQPGGLDVARGLVVMEVTVVATRSQAVQHPPASSADVAGLRRSLRTPTQPASIVEVQLWEHGILWGGAMLGARRYGSVTDPTPPPHQLAVGLHRKTVSLDMGTQQAARLRLATLGLVVDATGQPEPTPHPNHGLRARTMLHACGTLRSFLVPIAGSTEWALLDVFGASVGAEHGWRACCAPGICLQLTVTPRVTQLDE